MDKKQLQKQFLDYKNGVLPFSSVELNILRTDIFNEYNVRHIANATKIELLKSLYDLADEKGVYFLRVMDKKPMPVESVASDDEEDDEYSYSEEEISYS